MDFLSLIKKKQDGFIEIFLQDKNKSHLCLRAKSLKRNSLQRGNKLQIEEIRYYATN